MADLNVQLDPEDFTLDELSEVEELSGREIGEIFAGSIPSAKALKALVYVQAKRDNPDLAFDDIGAVKLSELS